MWLWIHVDAISAFKDIKDHLEMQKTCDCVSCTTL